MCGIIYKWEIPQGEGGNNMALTAKAYDAKIDSKKRISIRNAQYDYYHVEELDNGIIVLSPRVLADPFEVSKNTLEMMDKSMKNFKSGKVSNPVDLSEFEHE